MDNIEVSVIMPSYNSEQFLPATIDSVINQTFKAWELIIIDDCSPDNSNKIIEDYIQRSEKIKLISLKSNSGPAIARNRGIQEAKGRYIAFLDSDDLWHPDKLSKQLAFMKEQDVPLSFTGYDRIDEQSGMVIDQLHVPFRVDYDELLKQNIIGCLTAVYDTQKLGKVYMPDILKRQDFALWLRILKKIPYAYGLDESLAYYRVRTASVSSNKILASKYNWKLYREVEKLPLHKAIYCFGWYTYKSILRYKK